MGFIAGQARADIENQWAAAEPRTAGSELGKNTESSYVSEAFLILSFVLCHHNLVIAATAAPVCCFSAIQIDGRQTVPTHHFITQIFQSTAHPFVIITHHS